MNAAFELLEDPAPAIAPPITPVSVQAAQNAAEVLREALGDLQVDLLMSLHAFTARTGLTVNALKLDVRHAAQWSEQRRRYEARPDYRVGVGVRLNR